MMIMLSMMTIVMTTLKFEVHYISTLSSNAQTQLTTNATNIGINADNITTLTTQVNSLNTNTNGITYSSSNTNFSNLVYFNAGLNLPISQVLTIF